MKSRVLLIPSSRSVVLFESLNFSHISYAGFRFMEQATCAFATSLSYHFTLPLIHKVRQSLFMLSITLAVNISPPATAYVIGEKGVCFPDGVVVHQLTKCFSAADIIASGLAMSRA